MTGLSHSEEQRGWAKLGSFIVCNEPLRVLGPSAPLGLPPSLMDLTVQPPPPPSLNPLLLSALSLILSLLIKPFPSLSSLPASLSPGVGIEKELLHFLSGCPSPLGLD